MLTKLGKALEPHVFGCGIMDGHLTVQLHSDEGLLVWDGTGEHWPLFGAIMGILEEKYETILRHRHGIMERVIYLECIPIPIGLRHVKASASTKTEAAAFLAFN